MKIIFSAFVSALLVTAGCSNTQEAAKDNKKSKRFDIDISTKGLGLAPSSIKVLELNGSFAGCEDPIWSIPGASGIIYASEACTAPQYSQVKIIEENSPTAQPVTLQFNSGMQFKDSQGNVWTFQSNDGGEAILIANFQQNQEGSIAITNKKFSLEVSVDAGDGAICDENEPFLVTASDKNMVIISLTPPKGGHVEGVTLLTAGISEGLPAVHVNQDARRFEINLYNMPPAQYTYNLDFTAEKGRSFCKISSLKIDLRTVDEPVALQQKASINVAFPMFGDTPPWPGIVANVVKKFEGKQGTINLDLDFERTYDFSPAFRGWFFKTSATFGGDAGAGLSEIFGSTPQIVVEIDEEAGFMQFVLNDSTGGGKAQLTARAPVNIDAQTFPKMIDLPSMTGSLTLKALIINIPIPVEKISLRVGYDHKPVASDLKVCLTDGNANGLVQGFDYNGDKISFEIIQNPKFGAIASFSKETGAFSYKRTSEIPSEYDKIVFRAISGSITSEPASIFVYEPNTPPCL